MKILVTGDRGYVGSVMVPMLLQKGHEVVGLDIGYFEDCILEDCENDYEKNSKDIRDISANDFIGKKFDAIIHLAGLSNDPLGELSPHLTEDINFHATIKLGKLAKKYGVKRFIYASTQSLYGLADLSSELDEDKSIKNPMTSYAKTKWMSEQGLIKLEDKDFSVTFMRPSTVFGSSPRLRCDIVYNNFLASGYTSGSIIIKSDGTPWRPVVHIKDVCAAFIAVLDAPVNIISGKAFNVGIPNGNFTVKDIANAAQNSLSDCNIKFINENKNDERTYKVSFNRILNQLSDYYKPVWNLENGGKEIIDFFNKINFNTDQFLGKNCTRLNQLNFLKEKKIIDTNLRMNI